MNCLFSLVHTRFLLLSFAMSFYLLGCEPTVDFDVTLQGQSTIEGSGILGLPFGELLGELPLVDDFTTFDLATEEEFENNEAQKSQIRSAHIKRFSLKVLSPAEGDFDFLDEISFSAEADGVVKTRVAYLVFPMNENEVDLNLDDVDIAAHARADTMTLSTEVRGRLPEETTILSAEVVLSIRAGL